MFIYGIQLKMIPYSPIEYVPFHVIPLPEYAGFGYDCIEDDYKVIRWVTFSNASDYDTEWDYTPLYEIYSLRSKSWRKVKIDSTLSLEYHRSGQLYLDGMCHWLSFKTHYSGEYLVSYNGPYLVSFDMSNEEYYTTLVPLEIPSDIPSESFAFSSMKRYLFPLNGSVALVANYNRTRNIYIYILVEIGKKETWNKLFILGPLPYSARPFGAGSMGNILFETINEQEDSELFWFDISTHKITKIGLKKDFSRFFIVIYRKSILQIEEINN